MKYNIKQKLENHIKSLFKVKALVGDMATASFGIKALVFSLVAFSLYYTTSEIVRLSIVVSNW